MLKRLADIIPGADSTRSKILNVYSKIGATYAVYRTRERVAIQFADSPALGSEQRATLAKLNPLRGQINGLSHGWRAAGDGGRSHWRLFFWRAIDSHEIRPRRRCSTAGSPTHLPWLS